MNRLTGHNAINYRLAVLGGVFSVKKIMTLRHWSDTS